MSRATEGDSDSSVCFLWPSVVKRAIEGKRGQKLLKELEAALLAMPEKRLIKGAFSSKGEVCALGALEVERRVQKGTPRAIALGEVAEKFVDEFCGEQFDQHEVGKEMGIAPTLAWEIMFTNDDRGYRRDLKEETPEQRYLDVLKWVREHIRDSSEGSR